MSKTFFITGGAGFIGSHTCRYILNNIQNPKIIVLDNFARYQDPFDQENNNFYDLRFKDIRKNIYFERGDAQNFSIVYDCLKKYKPNFIIHLAAVPVAKTNNLNSFEMKAGSIDTTSCLIEVCAKLIKEKNLKLNKFVYISSSMVYGNFQKKIADEDHPLNPKEIYGTMKLSGEIVTRGLCNFYSIPFSIIRPSAVYGPTDMNKRVSQIFIDKAILKKKIIVNGKDESLDFTYVDDLAQGIVLATTNLNSTNETFNITFGKSRKLLDFIKILSKFVGKIDIEIKERDSFRPKRGTLGIKKARSLLNYVPKFPLEKGIKKYLEFLKIKKH